MLLPHVAPNVLLVADDTKFGVTVRLNAWFRLPLATLSGSFQDSTYDDTKTIAHPADSIPHRFF